MNINTETKVLELTPDEIKRIYKMVRGTLTYIKLKHYDVDDDTEGMIREKMVNYEIFNRPEDDNLKSLRKDLATFRAHKALEEKLVKVMGEEIELSEETSEERILAAVDLKTFPRVHALIQTEEGKQLVVKRVSAIMRVLPRWPVNRFLSILEKEYDGFLN